MSMDIYEFYTNLEPNHTVEVTDEVQVVYCPLLPEPINESTFSLNAEPEEVECLFCECVSGRRPELEGPSHSCGDDDPDMPSIMGGSGAQVFDYQPCKVPLRTITVFDVRITVHEGVVADCYEAERRWRAKGGPRWYRIEQHHTGAYNCRNSVGHSRAVAIDFNWQRQGYIKPKPASGCPQDPQMHEFWWDCWAPLGWGWGGNWRSACDAMHVSKIPAEGGNGRLYQTHGATPTPAPPPTPEPEPEPIAEIDEEEPMLHVASKVINGGEATGAVECGWATKNHEKIGVRDAEVHFLCWVTVQSAEGAKGVKVFVGERNVWSGQGGQGVIPARHNVAFPAPASGPVSVSVEDGVVEVQVRTITVRTEG